MAHIEQTRAVVEAGETYDGRIIPTVQAELDRPVRIRDEATVQGSIYGGSVETHDGAIIEGSIMSGDEINLTSTHVRSEVGTPGKVIGENSHIDGTVTGKRVRLNNCVVRGNVVGTEAIIENCVVLGLATASRSLTIEDSLCYTIRSQGETHLDNATFVLPQAITNGPLDLTTPITVVGLGQLDITDEVDDAEAQFPKMDESDQYEQDGTTYLTLAPRILNLEKITDRLDELERGIMEAIDDMSSHDESRMKIGEVLDHLDVDYDIAIN